MSKLYHVSVRAERWNDRDEDIIASNIAVATKRALDRKSLRNETSLVITVNRSNHGEYDKAAYTCFNGEGGSVWLPRDAQQQVYRVPTHVRRAEVNERLAIEAQRIIDTCPVVCVVKARSRGVHIIVKRAGYEHIEV